MKKIYMYFGPDYWNKLDGFNNNFVAQLCNKLFMSTFGILQGSVVDLTTEVMLRAWE